MMAVSLARDFFRAAAKELQNQQQQPQQESADSANASNNNTTSLVAISAEEVEHPLPSAMSSTATALMSFLSSFISSPQQQSQPQPLTALDTALASVLDVGDLMFSTCTKQPAAPSTGGANTKRISPHVALLLQAILCNNSSNDGGGGGGGTDQEDETAATTNTATIISRLLRAAGRAEPHAVAFTLAEMCGGPEPTKRPRIMLAVTKARLLVPQAGSFPVEEMGVAALLFGEFLQGFARCYSSTEDAVDGCSTNFLDKTLADSIGRASLHPSVVVDLFVEAGAQFADTLRLNSSSSSSSGIAVEADFFRELSCLKKNSSSSSSSSLLVQALRGSNTIVSQAVAHYVATVAARLRDLSSCGDFGSLALESHKAVFGIAFLFQQLSASALLTLETALSYLAVILQHVHAVPTSATAASERSFSSSKAHTALAEVAGSMSAHAQSATTEIVVDRRNLPPEQPGRVEIIGQGFYLLRFSVPRPSLATRDVATAAAAVPVGPGLQAQTCVGTVTPPAAAGAGAGAAGGGGAIGPPTLASFAVHLLRLGEGVAATEIIRRGLKAQLSSNFFVPGQASAAAGEPSGLLPTPSVDDAAAASSTAAVAAAAAATRSDAPLNLFLAPALVGASATSVTDAVATYVLAHLVGAAEVHQEVASATGAPSNPASPTRPSTAGPAVASAATSAFNRLDTFDEMWRTKVWPLLRLARSHLAGYSPVLLHGLLFLRSVISTLQLLRGNGGNGHQNQQHHRNLSTKWLQHTIDFFSQFLAPCQLVASSPAPMISDAAFSIVSSLSRSEQRAVVDALPSLAQISSANQDVLRLGETNETNNNTTSSSSNNDNSEQNDAAAGAATASMIIYPAERIALLRHSAMLNYCISRLTERDVADFAQLIAPVLACFPKLVIDKLLQRAIAYPSQDLQLTNARLLRDAPAIVFLLLPIMAVDRMRLSIRQDEVSAEQKVAALATLTTLAWRHSWEGFGALHLFDAIEASLAEPTKATLLLVLPLLKSTMSLLLMKVPESEVTYSAHHITALRGGDLLRWWTGGGAEALGQRWLPGLFTPSTLMGSSLSPSSGLWVRFLGAVAAIEGLPARLLWGLLQLMQAVMGIYQDARGTAESNTLRALVDTDMVRELSAIVVQMLMMQLDPREALLQKQRWLEYSEGGPLVQLWKSNNNNNRSSNDSIDSSSSSTPVLFRALCEPKILSLPVLGHAAPRSFALLHSAQRERARATLLFLNAKQHATKEAEKEKEEEDAAQQKQKQKQEHALLMETIICFGGGDEHKQQQQQQQQPKQQDDNNDDDVVPRFVDPIFGVALDPEQPEFPEPTNKAVASELEIFAVFWLLDLPEIAPFTNDEFAAQFTDAKNRIASFTQRADKNVGVMPVQSGQKPTPQQSALARRARRTEFDGRNDEEQLKVEQHEVVVKVAHAKAMALLHRVLVRNRALVEEMADADDESFAGRFLTCCLVPRAVASMSDALAVAAFVERLFHLEQLADSREKTNADENDDDDDGDDDESKMKQKKRNAKKKGGTAGGLRLLSVTLACNFVRHYCSVLSSFSPQEAKCGAVCLARLFWFAARHISTESLVELSAFVTQSVFGVLFIKKASVSAEGLDRGDGNTVPEFIQRTALNVVDALRAGPPHVFECFSDDEDDEDDDEENGETMTNNKSRSEQKLTVFPATATECKTLLPAVAVHARSSSPLYATATKLFHHLKSRCAQSQHSDEMSFAAVSDDALNSVLDSAIAVLLNKPSKADAENSNNTAAAKKHQHHHHHHGGAVLDDAVEAAMQILLQNELMQIEEAVAQEAGLLTSVDEDDAGAREEDEEEDGKEGERHGSVSSSSSSSASVSRASSFRSRAGDGEDGDAGGGGGGEHMAAGIEGQDDDDGDRAPTPTSDDGHRRDDDFDEVKDD